MISTQTTTKPPVTGAIQWPRRASGQGSLGATRVHGLPSLVADMRHRSSKKTFRLPSSEPPANMYSAPLTPAPPAFQRLIGDGGAWIISEPASGVHLCVNQPVSGVHG